MNIEKRKNRLNAIDFLIIILVLSAISFSVFLFVRAYEERSDKEQNIECLMEFDNVKRSFIENISVGDVLYDSKTGEQFGTIISILSDENAFSYSGDAGDVKTEYTAYTNLKLKLSVDVVKEGGSFYSGEVLVALDEFITLRNVNFYAGGVCSLISENGGEQ